MSNRLAEIEARLKAATPGPWHEEAWAKIILRGLDSGEGENIASLIRAKFAGEVDADARFIAHSPEDIKWLVAEVGRLRAELAGGEEADALDSGLRDILDVSL